MLVGPIQTSSNESMSTRDLILFGLIGPVGITKAGTLMLLRSNDETCNRIRLETNWRPLLNRRTVEKNDHLEIGLCRRHRDMTWLSYSKMSCSRVVHGIGKVGLVPPCETKAAVACSVLCEQHCSAVSSLSLSLSHSLTLSLYWLSWSSLLFVCPKIEKLGAPTLQYVKWDDRPSAFEDVSQVAMWMLCGSSLPSIVLWSND